MGEKPLETIPRLWLRKNERQFGTAANFGRLRMLPLQFIHFDKKGQVSCNFSMTLSRKRDQSISREFGIFGI
jgi:hypothetical protein